MTPREIILNQVQHRETEIVPYTLTFEGDIEERLNAYFGNLTWQRRLKKYISQIEIVHTMKKIPTHRSGYHRDPYGSIWRMDQLPFHLEQPALAVPSFAGYQWPAPEMFFASAEEIEKIRADLQRQSEEYFLIAWIGWGLFETSWGIRGFENVLTDVIAEPHFYEDLLDRITEQFLAYIDYTCDALPELDAIIFGDDWGDQRGVIIGPDRWRALFKHRYAKIYEAVHARGKFVFSHCCGSIAEIFPDLIEIKLDLLESVQPEAVGMNPYELKRMWGDRIALWGCLGSQSTIPFGTPDSIRDEVRSLRQHLGKGGGFILAPAKALQPGTPIQNAVAVVEAFAEAN